MPVVRTYRCDCSYEFTHFHARRDEDYPECPACAGVVAWQPGPFAISTNRSKAIDVAQSVAENEYGFTDLQDNQREGDVAAPKVSPMQTAEAEQLTRAMKEAQDAATQGPAPDAPPQMKVADFWQPSTAQAMQNPAGYSAPGAQEARSLGVDAVSLVEKAKTTGQDRMNFRVLARGNGS